MKAASTRPPSHGIPHVIQGEREGEKENGCCQLFLTTHR